MPTAAPAFSALARTGAAPSPCAQSFSVIAAALSWARASAWGLLGEGFRWKSGRVPSGAEQRTT
ncbi:MAG: hypothetical protein HYZ29_27840 [Myxococcales bacterium]|nr:hypothetical protein [Myxococcales bacterium]